MDNELSIGDIAYDLSWYQMPRDNQYIVETILRRSQKPIELKGLGVFVCSLTTFLKVNSRDFLPSIVFYHVVLIFIFFADDSERYVLLYDLSTNLNAV